MTLSGPQRVKNIFFLFNIVKNKHWIFSILLVFISKIRQKFRTSSSIIDHLSLLSSLSCSCFCSKDRVFLLFLLIPVWFDRLWNIVYRWGDCSWWIWKGSLTVVDTVRPISPSAMMSSQRFRIWNFWFLGSFCLWFSC